MIVCIGFCCSFEANLFVSGNTGNETFNIRPEEQEDNKCKGWFSLLILLTNYWRHLYVFQWWWNRIWLSWMARAKYREQQPEGLTALGKHWRPTCLALDMRKSEWKMPRRQASDGQPYQKLQRLCIPFDCLEGHSCSFYWVKEQLDLWMRFQSLAASTWAGLVAVETDA